MEAGEVYQERCSNILVSKPSGSDYLILSEKKRNALKMLAVWYALIQMNVNSTEDRVVIDIWNQDFLGRAQQLSQLLYLILEYSWYDDIVRRKSSLGPITKV